MVSNKPCHWNERTSFTVSQCHCGAAEDVDVGDDTTPGQSIAEPAEGILDQATIQQRLCPAHATSSSWAATKTPRRRNAAGAWTTASTRAAGVLKGNH